MPENNLKSDPYGLGTLDITAERDRKMRVEEKRRKDLALLVELRNESNKLERDWLARAVGTLSIILGLIISLKKQNLEATDTYLLIFVVTVTTTLLTILCGLVLLYRDADTSHRLAQSLSKHISSGSQKGILIATDPKKFFVTLRVCFFVLIVASIICLGVYATYSEFSSLVNN